MNVNILVETEGLPKGDLFVYVQNAKKSDIPSGDQIKPYTPGV